MEPERKIEKWLRAWAKKRRADAAAFKLHPATRRMLQDEVARRAPGLEEEPESLSLWDVIRDRWAVLLGFALVIFFGATLFLPALSKAKNRAQNVETASKLRQIGAAAQIAAVDNRGRLPASLDVLTNQLGSRQMLTDSVSGKPFVYVAGGAKVSDLQSTSVLAYSSSDKDHAVLFADGSVRRVRKDEFSALTNSTALTLSLAETAPTQKLATPPVAAEAVISAPRTDVTTMVAAAKPEVAEPSAMPAPAAAPSSVSGSTSATTGIVALAGEMPMTVLPPQSTTRFKAPNDLLLGMNNSQRYRQIANPPLPPVLNSFEVRQSGSQLEIVDADGSVYNGSVQPVAVTESKDLAKTLGGTVKADGADRIKKDLAQTTDDQGPAQNFSFRVSGANRSLKQNVVFTGNVVANELIGHNRVGAGGAALPAGESSLLSNSRITGTVTINGTNLEVNAWPVTP